MNETQKRIKAYKAALPGLRERVAAVALLLVMSMVMLTSASFAWITLSRAPEVTGVNTTVAANGSLEIALAKPDGTEPAESMVGDSSAAEGQTVVKANQTWGNLVNLSDASYGLENIVLRPALLGNGGNLLDQPLKGVNYSNDGRVELHYNEDYKLTSWVEPKDGVEGYFEYYAMPKYGVRAISTVEITYKDNKSFMFNQLLTETKNLRDTVNGEYDALLGNSDYLNTLAGFIAKFMEGRVDDNNPNPVISEYIEGLYNMMCDFEEIIDHFGEVLVSTANLQVYNQYGPDTYKEHTYTYDTFFAATPTELSANGVSITCLDKYLALKSKMDKALWGTNPDVDDGIADFYIRYDTTQEDILLNEVKSVLTSVIDIDSCIIKISDSEQYKVSQIGTKVAMSLVLGGKTKVDAIITKGIIKDFEQLTGYKMCATNVKVTASAMGMNVTLTAKTITTDATDPFALDIDLAATEEVAAGAQGDRVISAQDTYGMALDFWVRTNAADSYLKLEGNVLTTSESVRATSVDEDGNPVDLYSVTITSKAVDPETQEESDVYEDYAVYKRTEDGKDVWYYANTHQPLYDENGNAPEGQSISTPIERMTEVVTVTGYEGENRVWEDNIFLDVDSTTQGSGSCYVFYAEDPAQQANSLRLLSNMRVAFIDSTPDNETYGKMVAIAQFDIDRRYEDSGKVTVPLKLVDDGSAYLTKIEEGIMIMPLDQNKATRIMAIVYLDGRNISNADVMAANDIQGRLNIQFGNTIPMETIGDSKLEQAVRSVSAVAKRHTDGEYPGSNSLITYDYDTVTSVDEMTVNVKVVVNGDVPNNVSAFFMRQVNETQGSREERFNLTRSETDASVWEGSYTFKAPGTYVLRDVQLDGVDYDLPHNDCPKVYIKGFAIQSVTCDLAPTTEPVTVYTGARGVSANLTLTFASNQTRLPGSVRLQFVKDDGSQIYATMTYNPTSKIWSGSADFMSSGHYTLRYVIMDGEYTELADSMQRELEIYMGMKVKITGDKDTYNTTFTGGGITAPVEVEIFDNEDNPVPYLRDVKLVYSGSAGITSGMDADLTWNAATGCYKGNLTIGKPGIYRFANVTLAGSTVTATVKEPPVYTCISPEPPVYLDAQPMVGMDYFIDTDATKHDIVAGVRIDNATAATVTAVFHDADTNKTHEVSTTVENGTDNVFKFVLPTDSTGYQHGDWTITALKIANVYDADSNFYGPDNPMFMDLSGSADDLHIKVISIGINAVGNNETISGGAFMETATPTEEFAIYIADHRGNPLTVSDLQVTYGYNQGSSETYGGYTFNDSTVADIVITPESVSNGIKYNMQKPALPYAGKYTPLRATYTITYENDGVEYTLTRDYTGPMPTYIVETVRPTVSISDILPKGTHGAVRGSNNITVTSKIEGNTATVYAECEVTGWIIKRGKLITEPRVVLSLSGIGNADEAFAKFTTTDNGGTVYLYTEADRKGQTDAFSWSEDGTVNRYIGYNVADDCSGSKAAGTLTCNELTLNHEGIEFTVAIDTITLINNKP